MNKTKLTPIKVGQLDNLTCPVCGRFYSEGYLDAALFDGAKDEYRPMCIRCILSTPEVTEMAKVGDNMQILSALIKKWDVDYKKALKRKLASGNPLSLPIEESSSSL